MSCEAFLYVKFETQSIYTVEMKTPKQTNTQTN